MTPTVWHSPRSIEYQSVWLAFAIALMVPAGEVVVSAAETNDRPNIIFILADDMGIGDVSHNGGLAPTPHLDRLAAGGMRMTDAHTTSSVCTPTRYGILTGRYNWRSRLKSGVLFGPDQPLIPTERKTIAQFLNERGYRTGVVGKWHLGLGWQTMPDGELFPGTPESERARPFKELHKSAWTIDYSQPVTGGPNQLGFDESFIIPASLDMFPYVYLRDDHVVEEPTTIKAFHRPGPAAASFEAVNCLRDFARESREFIASSDEQPFFLYLPLSSPHTPIVPSQDWKGKSDLSEYGDFLMETDWVVGQVLDQLDELNLTDQTLMVFTTDNGCSPQAKIPELQAKGHSPNGKLRGHKADIFDGGHRVPFLVHWPAVVEAGTRSDQLVSTVDAFATFADVIGAKIEIPDDVAEDSFSFLPILRGVDEAVRPFLIHHSINGSFAIRQGRWKLNLCAGSGGWSNPRPPKALKAKSLPPVQLYDMQADIAESNNLIEHQPDIADSLADLLVEAIANGRTTPGEKVANEGWPKTFAESVRKLYPALSP